MQEFWMMHGGEIRTDLREQSVSRSSFENLKRSKMKIKVLHLFLVVLVMLTFSAGAARADAPTWEMGYIPLLTELSPDPGFPFEMQAQNALEHLTPILFLEKERGALLEYKPEFNAGVLILKYVSGKRPATLAGVKVFDDIHLALAVVPHLQQVNSEATSSAHVRVFLFNSCFYVSGLLPGNHVIGSLRNGAQRVIAVSESDVNDSSNFHDCFQWQGTSVIVSPGDQVTIKVYASTGGALQDTLTSYVPNIRFTGLDQVNKIAKGRGPAGKPYHLCWQYRKSATVFSSQCQPGSILNTFDWSTQFANSGPARFLGGDGFFIYVDFNAHFDFQLQMWFPNTQCYLNDKYCSLYGFAGRTGFLTATHAGKAYTLTGTFAKELDGLFVGTTFPFPITLMAGDLIKGTNVSSYSLPNLTATINYVTNVVSGKAPANSYFVVTLFNENTSTWYELLAHSNTNGNYSVDFTSKLDLKSTDTIMVDFDYWNNITGNQTSFRKVFAP